MDREDEIRLMAYQIWKENGYPEEQALENWLKAEQTWNERNQSASAIPVALQAEEISGGLTQPGLESGAGPSSLTESFTDRKSVRKPSASIKRKKPKS